MAGCAWQALVLFRFIEWPLWPASTLLLPEIVTNEDQRKIIELHGLLPILTTGVRTIGSADRFLIGSNRRLTWTHIRCDKIFLGAGLF